MGRRLRHRNLRLRHRIRSLRQHLAAPIDPLPLVVFRVGFGLLAALAALRFVWKGWVEELLIAPTTHFSWWPGVIEEPAPGVLYGLFLIQFIAGLGIAWGRGMRLWLGAWLLAFGYVELIDKALYLNHYVLFTLLGLMILLSPASSASLRPGCDTPRWSLWWLRLAVALVYTWAGIAKLNPDWLLRGEPLATWLGARVDLPLVGPLLAWSPTALAMSWAGALYDLSIPWLLLHRRTLPLGLLLVVGFHVTVGWLFPIGIFPWLMILGVTLFVPARWWRALAQRVPRLRLAPLWTQRPLGAGHRSRRRLGSGTSLALAASALLLALFPGRSLLYRGHTGWHERGHRFAWRVMLIEKTGLVRYTVVEPVSGRRWRVMPERELAPFQVQQLRTQPDLIRDFAIQLAARYETQIGAPVAVYADAWASLHGRPTQRLLREDVDLTQPLRALRAQQWIVPLEGSFRSRSPSAGGARPLEESVR